MAGFSLLRHNLAYSNFDDRAGISRAGKEKKGRTQEVSMMKRYLIACLLLVITFVNFGCGQSPKAREFNDYLKGSEIIIRKLNGDISSLEKKNAILTDNKLKLQNLALEKEKIKQAVKDLNKLPRPKEMNQYHQKYLQVYDQAEKLLTLAEEGLKKGDLKKFMEQYQEIQKANGDVQKDLAKIIDQAAADAGLQVVRKDNKVLFR